MVQTSASTADPAPNQVDRQGQITVGAERVQILTDQWTARWKRPPTNIELTGLIRQWVADEILYREAISRGLDRDDELVRRRLIQKMYGIARGLAELTEPSEDELRAFYLGHPERYVVPARRSFRQVYIKAELGDGNAANRATTVLAELSTEGGARASQLGDPFVLAHEFALLSSQEVSARFGPAFADRLFELAPGEWRGPLRSAFGLHLVEVTTAAAEYAPTFEEARDRVRIDLSDERSRAAEGGLVASVATEYDVVYDWEDEDLEEPEVGDIEADADPTLLGTLAVLAPRRGQSTVERGRIPLDSAGHPDWPQVVSEVHHTGSHGDIALAGGSPRRATLIEPRSVGSVEDPAYRALAAEFSRGLRLTTGARVVDGTAGWVGFTCDTEAKAIWMVRALAAENLTVRREGMNVLLPMSASFALEDEILDMVLATAHVHHFFEDHIRVDDHEHE